MSKTEFDFDYISIGGGSGGIASANRAAQHSIPIRKCCATALARPSSRPYSFYVQFKFQFKSPDPHERGSPSKDNSHSSSPEACAAPSQRAISGPLSSSGRTRALEALPYQKYLVATRHRHSPRQTSRPWRTCLSVPAPPRSIEASTS